MKLYSSPFVLFLNGTITMSASQLGTLGVGMETVGAWNDFWAEHEDDIKSVHPDFDVNDVEGNLENYGFDLSDPDTWFNLLF